MKNTKFTKMAVLAIAAFAVLAGGASGQEKKLTAAEIIQKHLDSIGTAETRSAMKNYFAVGGSSFASKMPAKSTQGKALIVSQDTNIFMIASFMSQEYPFEKIGYFNEKLSLPHVTAGARSPLGAFIADHESMLSTGVFTGSMSAAWPFLEGRKLKAKIDDAGTRKVDGKKAYVIDFFPNATISSEFTIKLFFDAEKFHHLRTEYRHVITPDQDKFGQLGRQAGVKLVVIEKFSDHKTVEGMTLPHSYAINYLTDSNSGTFEYDWGFTITNYYFNQKLEPGFFSFDTDKKG